jgi:hypothetical protein
MQSGAVQAAYRRNLELAQREDFADLMIAEIKVRDARRVRVHVSGDFFSAAYTQQWVKIARASPQTVFLAYTRSWRDAAVWPVLRRWSRLRNARLWLSWDRDMAVPPKGRTWRRCFLSTAGEDPARGTPDLVFRDRRDPLLKFTANGALVCPYEQGTAVSTQLTCERCQLCLRTKALPRQKSTLTLTTSQ